MDCLLCSSRGGGGGSTATAAAVPLQRQLDSDDKDDDCSSSKNSAVDVVVTAKSSSAESGQDSDLTCTGRKLAACLCQLLGLPATPFHQYFLQPNIGFCSACTQFLTTVNSLFDQLGQLQAQIAESKDFVSRSLSKSVDSDNICQQRSSSSSESSNGSGSMSTQSLRRQVLRASTSRIQEDQQDLSSESRGIVISAGFVVDDTFKEEVEDLSESLEDLATILDTAPWPSPPTAAAAAAATMDEDNVNSNSSFLFTTMASTPQEPKPNCSIGTIANATMTSTSTDSKTNPGRQIRSSNSTRPCSIPLTRLGEKELSKYKSRASGSGSQKVPTTTSASFLDVTMVDPEEPEDLPLPSDDEHEDDIADDYDNNPGTPLPGDDSDFDSDPDFILPHSEPVEVKSSKSSDKAEVMFKPKVKKPRKKTYQPKESIVLEEPVPCSFPECPESFTTMAARKTHLKDVHSACRGNWKCPKCPTISSSELKFQAHLSLHTGERRFLCQQCGKAYRSDYLLRQHIKRHAGARPIQCKICSKNFANTTTLSVHMRSHSQTGGGPFMCEHCGSLTFKSKLELSNHHAKVHGIAEAVNDLKCRICGRIYHTPKYRRVHELTHSGDVEFKCQLCEFKCGTYARLQLHLKSHSEERPFPCQHCGKSFKYKGHLKTHVAIHSEDKAHKCSECPKSFKAKSLLSRHSALHKGLQKYKCEICDVGFPILEYLKYHMKRHEEGKIPSQYKCRLPKGQGQGQQSQKEVDEGT